MRSFKRLYLEFAVTVKNPYLKNEMKKLKKIQHTARNESHTLKYFEFKIKAK